MSSNNLPWSHIFWFHHVPHTSIAFGFGSFAVNCSTFGRFFGFVKKQLWDALHLGLILWMMDKNTGNLKQLFPSVSVIFFKSPVSFFNEKYNLPRYNWTHTKLKKNIYNLLSTSLFLSS